MSQKNTILNTNVGSGSSGVKQRSPRPPTRSFSGGGMRKNPPPSPFSGGRLPHRQSSAIVLPTSSKLPSSLKLSSSSTITNHVSNVNANVNANTNNFHTNTIAPSPSSTKSTPMIIPSSRRRTQSHQSFQPPLTPQQYHPRVQHQSSQQQQKSASSSSQLSFSDWLLYVCFTKRRFIPLLQMILALSVTAMVLQSRYQASYATQQLQSFQIEEGKLLLQLKKLERQSLRLHDNIRRRLVKATTTTTTTTTTTNNDENEKDAHQQQQESNNDNNSKNKGKPGNKKEELSLEAQTSELIQMTQELDAQVATLQGHIQASARQQIVQHYGEGAIKVVWELEFWNKDFTKKNKKKRANTVSILLWPDTPHAAWTWLEQISRGVWDNASFHLSDREPLSLRATPIHPDPLHKGQLEFVEDDSSPHTPDEKNNNPHWHKAWTVGLREASYTYYNDPLASSSENNNNKKDNNESDPKPITRIRSGKDAASMRREIENNEKQNKPGDDDMDNRLAIFVNLQDNSKYHALGSNEPCIGRIIDGYDTLQRLMLEASQTTQGDVPSSIWISKTTVMHMTRRELDML